MNVFVTGGNGFLGRALVRFLVEAGHQVVAPVRGEAPFSIDGVTWQERASFDDSGTLRRLMSGTDAIVHCAAYAHQTRTTTDEDRDKFQAVNVDLTASLYALANECQVPHFVFISSIGAITGMSDEVVSESTEPSPIDDYGRSKRNAELKLLELRQSSDTSVTILRPTLIYGPGNPGNMQRLARLVDSGLPLPFASVRATRSLSFVQNVCSAIAACLASSRAADRDYIVCDSESVVLGDLIRLIAAAKGKRVRLLRVHRALLAMLGKIGDLGSAILGRSLGIDSYSVERLTGSLECDNSRIREELDWVPPATLQSGIEASFGD